MRKKDLLIDLYFLPVQRVGEGIHKTALEEKQVYGAFDVSPLHRRQNELCRVGQPARHQFKSTPPAAAAAVAGTTVSS